MARRLVFDGLGEGCKTWFETRRSPDASGQIVGGDPVFASRGDSFPEDYVDPQHAENLVKRGIAHFVEIEPEKKPEPTPEPKRSFFTRTESESEE